MKKKKRALQLLIYCRVRFFLFLFFAPLGTLQLLIGRTDMYQYEDRYSSRGQVCSSMRTYIQQYEDSHIYQYEDTYISMRTLEGYGYLY